MGTDSVIYVWTPLDQAIAQGKTPGASKYVTPYLLLPSQIPDAATIQPGTKVEVDRSKSEQKLYNTFFVPNGYEWVKIPDGITGSTIEELCAALLASDPKGNRFPPLYYDLNAKNKVWPGNIPIWRLLFDYWSNTEYRYAYIKAKGDFRDTDVTAKLATESGGQRLAWVLALKARVEDVHVVPRVSQTASPQVKKIDAGLAPPKMRVGINHPWAFDKYGLYIGPHSEAWIDRWFLFLGENLAKAKSEWDVQHVRMFILCNGYNYGEAKELGRSPILSMPPLSGGIEPSKVDNPILRKYAETTQGGPILRAPNNWTFDPPAKLHQKFLDDWKRVLDIFKTAGCKIIPSLLDFGAFAPIAAGGKRDLVVDKTKRRIFMDTVLEEFLMVSQGYKDQIYAWEVMNEPSWTTRVAANPISNDKMGLMAYVPDLPILGDGELDDFLADALGRIEARGFASTVGHRTYRDMLKYKTGTRRQFHFYGWPLVDNPGASQVDSIADLELKRWLLSDRIPVDRSKRGIDDPENTFVGEIGAGDHGLSWSELNGADKGGARNRVFERLKLVARKGYPLALLWPDTPWRPPAGPPDTAVDRFCFSDDAVLGITDFTFGLFPNGVP